MSLEFDHLVLIKAWCDATINSVVKGNTPTALGLSNIAGNHYLLSLTKDKNEAKNG